jgi:hypothetical protein
MRPFNSSFVVGYAHANLYTLWMKSMLLVVLMFVAMIGSIVAACWLLLRLDRSSIPRRIFQPHADYLAAEVNSRKRGSSE